MYRDASGPFHAHRRYWSCTYPTYVAGYPPQGSLSAMPLSRRKRRKRETISTRSRGFCTSLLASGVKVSTPLFEPQRRLTIRLSLSARAAWFKIKHSLTSHDGRERKSIDHDTIRTQIIACMICCRINSFSFGSDTYILLPDGVLKSGNAMPVSPISRSAVLSRNFVWPTLSGASLAEQILHEFLCNFEAKSCSPKNALKNVPKHAPKNAQKNGMFSPNFPSFFPEFSVCVFLQ